MKEIHQNYGNEEGEDIGKGESGDGNGTWLETCNCNVGYGADS